MSKNTAGFAEAGAAALLLLWGASAGAAPLPVTENLAGPAGPAAAERENPPEEGDPVSCRKDGKKLDDPARADLPECAKRAARGGAAARPVAANGAAEVVLDSLSPEAIAPRVEQMQRFSGRLSGRMLGAFAGAGAADAVPVGTMMVSPQKSAAAPFKAASAVNGGHERFSAKIDVPPVRLAAWDGPGGPDGPPGPPMDILPPQVRREMDGGGFDDRRGAPGSMERAVDDWSRDCLGFCASQRREREQDPEQMFRRLPPP